MVKETVISEQYVLILWTQGLRDSSYIQNSEQIACGKTPHLVNY